MTKYLIASMFLILSYNAYSVCSSPISRTDAGFSTILTSARYNADLNTVYNRANNLPGDCIVDGTVTSSKLATGSVTNSKIQDGVITASKLAPGTIPEVGRLLRVKAFTSTDVWTKGSDVGSIFVQVVGGGGASYHVSSTNGGTSSFGEHCTANGGQKPVAGGNGASGGAGGTAFRGHINLQGGNGDPAPDNGFGYAGYGGVSMLGFYGAGGVGSDAAISGGGGAGAYCAKLISASELGSTENAVVGTGGSNPGARTIPGKDGIVIVYEYSL